MFIGTFGAFFSFPPTPTQKSPQHDLPEPLRDLPGDPPEVKSVYFSLLGRSKAAKANFWEAPGLSGRAPGHPRRAQEAPRAPHKRPKSAQEVPGGPRDPQALQEPFWSDFGAAGERFGPNFDRCQQHLRGNLLLHLRGAWAEPRRTAQRRSRTSCRKSFPKSLPSHLQARCAEHMSH